MTKEKELGRLLLNEETGLLTLKMNSLQDVNVPPDSILLIRQNPANGKVDLIVEGYKVFWAAPRGSNRRVITVPTRT